jgi:hypothetical protein
MIVGIESILIWFEAACGSPSSLSAGDRIKRSGPFKNFIFHKRNYRRGFAKIQLIQSRQEHSQLGWKGRTLTKNRAQPFAYLGADSHGVNFID